MKRENIKFKRAHFDYQGDFMQITTWGFYDGGFASPASLSGEHKAKSIDLQFTGIKDKNDVEIYEGDIVKDSEMAYTVIWSEFRYDEYTFIGWCLKHKDPRVSVFGTSQLDGNVFEVIGNIYLTPTIID